MSQKQLGGFWLMVISTAVFVYGWYEAGKPRGNTGLVVGLLVASVLWFIIGACWLTSQKKEF